MAPAPRLSRELDRYLVDGERLVFAVHQHWGRVAEPVASAAVGGVVALWLDSEVDPSLAFLSTLVWWLWIALALRAAWELVNWRHDWFIATDKRLLLFHGFITRRVPMMPLTKVTDMAYERSVPGRLLGYGRFVLESAGQDQALHKVSWVPDPDHHYRVICAEIFGVADHERVFPPQDRWDDEGPPGLPPVPGVPDPYAGWDDPQHRHDVRTHDVRAHGSGSLYRSPDLRARDRSADTGPIPIRPRRDRGDDQAPPRP
jgi:hypothetical protein